MSKILQGDCRDVLKTLPDNSVQCVVTSPPYFGLRSYGIGIENGEIGLEATPDCGLRGKVRLRRCLTVDQQERVGRWLLGAAGFDVLRGGNDDKA